VAASHQESLVNTHCPPPSGADLPGRRQDDALLDARLEAALSVTSGVPGAVAVGVAGRGRTAELVVRALPADDPVRHLFGFVAPAHWTAFGIIADGCLVADRGPGQRDDVAREPVRVGLLIARSGRFVVRVEAARAATASDRPRRLGAPGQGRLIDGCRRVLGLSTDPPAHDSHELWSVLWLDSLLARAAVDPHRSWADLVRCHPGVVALARVEPGAVPEAMDHLVELGSALRQVWPWDRLLASARAGHFSVLGLSADDAAWMDVGMFSREVLGSFEPVDDLLDELDELLGPDLVGRIELALGRSGIDRPRASADRCTGRGRCSHPAI
jgi:hypothetical protein